ncbi:MAG TPA: toll/interleukin-1 receptor domain-containing protein [Blastocatellia bacterium]|nr:toll/interleukin-1 receptor domain-containing protein [Blastocatellia bacterium]
MAQIEIFISYSRENEEEKNELLSHLRVLQHYGQFDLWSDDRIGAGENWKKEIEDALDRARIAILLITVDYLNTEFIMNEEVPRILERHKSESITIIPLIGRHCLWERIIWLKELEVRPKDRQPVWGDSDIRVDRDLAALAGEIMEIVERESQIRPQPDAEIHAQEADPSVRHAHLIYFSTTCPKNNVPWLSYIDSTREWLKYKLSGRAKSSLDPAISQLFELVKGKLSDWPSDATHCELRQDGAFVATSCDPADILNFALQIARQLKERKFSFLSVGVHSLIIPPNASVRESLSNQGRDVEIACQLAGFGDNGHILASQQTAEIIRKRHEFASLFHNAGRREVAPLHRMDIYNIYALDVGNKRQPAERVLQKIKTPRTLRELKEEKIKISFWPNLTFIKVRFEVTHFDNSDKDILISSGNRESGHLTFEFHFGGDYDSFKQTFGIIARKIKDDSFFVLRLSCYDENGERIGVPEERRITLLKKPELKSVVSIVPHLWYQFIRLNSGIKTAIIILALLGPGVYVSQKVDLTRLSQLKERAYVFIGLQPKQAVNCRWDWFDVRSDGKPNELYWDYPEGRWKIIHDSTSEEQHAGVLLVNGPSWGGRNDLGHGEALFNFWVRFWVNFNTGSKAGWVLRAQQDKMRGYVFELEKRGSELFLNGWVYTDKGKAPMGNTPDNRLRLSGPFSAEDYFEITATVENYRFQHALVIKSSKITDDKGKLRENVNKPPYIVTPFDDSNETFPFGNVGFFAPSGNDQILVDNFELNCKEKKKD